MSDTNQRTNDKVFAFILLLICFIVIYLLQLGVMPLISQDEPRYAEVAREMLASGNWIVPHLDGMVYFEKPPLCYWMTAISMKIFGINNFACRFPSALCTGLTAFCIFFFMRKYSEDKRIALIASLIFLSFGLVLALGTFTVFDAQFSFFIAAAIFSFYTAYKTEKRKAQILFLILAGIFAGLGFLIKGFLIIVLLGLVLLPFLIWEKAWKKILTMPWIPLISFMVVILPWTILITLKSPDFWTYFIFVQNFDRFSSAHENTILHPEPFWFYIPILIAGALPCFFQIPTIARGLFKKKIYSSSLIRLCGTWIIFPFLFFSSSTGKLPTYILPIFPALAILFTYSLLNALQDMNFQKIFNLTNRIIAYVFLLAVLGSLIYVPLSLFLNIPKLWSLPQLLAGTIVIVIFSLALLLSAKLKSTYQKVLIFALAPVLLMGFKSYITPEFALEKQTFGKFILSQQEHIKENTTLLSYQTFAGATCYYLERTDVYIYDGTGDMEYPLSLPENRHRFISEEGLTEFIKDNAGNPGGLAVFVRQRHLKYFPFEPVYSIEGPKKARIVFAYFNTGKANKEISENK